MFAEVIVDISHGDVDKVFEYDVDEQIAMRMQRIEYEISKKELYDYVVINDDLESTVKKICEIIKNEKAKSL